MQFLIYDLEIIKAIPPKNPGDRIPDIEYCGGWDDHVNMGISVGAMSVYDTLSDTIDFIGAYSDIYGLKQALDLHRTGRYLCGFNSSRFDDWLLAANGIHVASNYDILLLVLGAANIGPDDRYWDMGLSYSMANICASNGLAKTMSGEQAPIAWQLGRKKEVIDYCINDAVVEAEILRRLYRGELVDPNNGNILKWNPDR